jgi:hypothetical protein
MFRAVILLPPWLKPEDLDYYAMNTRVPGFEEG